ncbi:MAG: hypothetical protein WBA89_16720 [Microcoleus sp.]|uniref:hypothetical protein n=1 Tax=Microcoleus sp. TaxID=44472 RepID=UPI003C73BD79
MRADSAKIRSPAFTFRSKKIFLNRYQTHYAGRVESALAIASLSTARLVSSRDQKEDLVRQVQVLEAFSAANGWNFEPSKT